MPALPCDTSRWDVIGDATTGQVSLWEEDVGLRDREKKTEAEGRPPLPRGEFLDQGFAVMYIMSPGLPVSIL
jgi:hypothetical protein